MPLRHFKTPVLFDGRLNCRLGIVRAAVKMWIGKPRHPVYEPQRLISSSLLALLPLALTRPESTLSSLVRTSSIS